MEHETGMDEGSHWRSVLIEPDGVRGSSRGALRATAGVLRGAYEIFQWAHVHQTREQFSTHDVAGQKFAIQAGELVRGA